MPDAIAPRDPGLEGLKTEEMVLNMGPHHPSTHGVLRFILTTDGEVIHRSVPDIGYLHRSIEKIAERVPYAGFMPFTDRIDYLASVNCNIGWAMAVEKLAGIEVPERAEYIRVAVAELNRIISHLVASGAVNMDLGAVTPFMHAIRERETVNDLFEALCGARLTYNYARIGGVAHDLPDGWKERALAWLDHFAPVLENEYNKLITWNKIFIERLARIAPVTAEDAIAYGLSGPNLRASGVRWDLRRDDPYSVYPKLDFEVCVGRGEKGTVGDCFDRYIVRIREMVESAKIVRQCLAALPEGPVQAKVPRVVKPPPGEVYGRTEAPRGELGYFVVSDGTDKPYRVKIRTGSFTALGIVEKVAPGWMISDFVAILASLDPVAPEVDR